jgi:hypothetical protein
MSITLATELPKGTEYLVDALAPVAQKTGFSPYLLLGFTYAESNFGLALKPPGPSGSGDFIARPCSSDRDARMAKSPLPGVVRKTLPDGIKARKIVGPVEAWVPTHTGWGCGVLQIDYEAHFEFCKSGAWRDPAKSCEYACGILKSARSSLQKNMPELTGIELDRAMIAAYNAGAGRVVKMLKAGKTLDDATFHPGYVDKITKKADQLAGASGVWRLG